MTDQEYNPLSPKETLRSIQVFYVALVAGLVLFAGIVIAVDLMNGPVLGKEATINSDILLWAVIITGVICIFGARNYYNKTMSLVDISSFLLKDKLNQYRAALIIYMAFCEGPAIFSVIIFFLSGNYWVLIMTALLLTAMLLKAPTRARIIREMKLDWKEQQAIEKIQ
jgi:hypothetical protein